MSYALAEDQARRMEARGQRSEVCKLERGHGWHVIWVDGLNHPCGGGPTRVRTQGQDNS